MRRLVNYVYVLIIYFHSSQHYIFFMYLQVPLILPLFQTQQIILSYFIDVILLSQTVHCLMPLCFSSISSSLVSSLSTIVLNFLLCFLKDGGCFFSFWFSSVLPSSRVFPSFLSFFFFLSGLTAVSSLFSFSCPPLVLSDSLRQTPVTVTLSSPWCGTSQRASTSSKPRPSSPGRSSSRFTGASKM